MEVLEKGRAEKNRRKILDLVCSPQVALFVLVQGLEPVIEAEQASWRDCGEKEVGMSPQDSQILLAKSPVSLVRCRNPGPWGMGGE